MFYSQYVLAKKGPLSSVWISAHWNRKLTKQQIFKIDLLKAIESIEHPDVPMALRMSGHLLLGVTRIYSRKVVYLLGDCNDAMKKIKMAFLTSDVDLPEAQVVAPMQSITLGVISADAPIELSWGDDLDFNIPNPEKFVRAPALTLRNNDALELGESSGTASQSHGDSDEFFGVADNSFLEFNEGNPMSPIDGDQFDGSLSSIEAERAVAAELAAHDDFGNLEQGGYDEEDFGGIDIQGYDDSVQQRTPQMGNNAQLGDVSINSLMVDLDGGIEALAASVNRDDAIAGAAQPLNRNTKRKLAEIHVDKTTIIPAKVMRARLRDTSALVRKVEIAPPTKRLMVAYNREMGGVKAQFENPLPIMAPELLEVFRQGVADEDLNIPLRDDIEEYRATQKLIAENGEAGLDELSPNLDLTLGDTAHISVNDLGVEMPANFDEYEAAHGEFDEEDYGGQEITGADDWQAADERQDEALVDDDENDAEASDAEEGYVAAESWSGRTARMLTFLQSTMADKESLEYQDLVEGKKRRTVAGTFFELLVLKSRGVIDVEQNEPYATITIHKTAHFDAPVIATTS